jgi:hypothetical protein
MTARICRFDAVRMERVPTPPDKILDHEKCECEL